MKRIRDAMDNKNEISSSEDDDPITNINHHSHSNISVSNNDNHNNNNDTTIIPKICTSSNTSSIGKGSCKKSFDDDDNNTSIKNDGGHLYGNFHNYYTFHPVVHRTKYLDDIIHYIANDWLSFSTPSTNTNANADQPQLPQSSSSSMFRYLDIGCNEGDLTLEVAKLLSHHILSTSLSKNTSTVTTTTTTTAISCTGIDIDPELIRRAQSKVQDQLKTTNVVDNKNIRTVFHVSDVLRDGVICDNEEDSNNTIEVDNPLSLDQQYNNQYDFITVFSTTMWIHIHGGDDGLRRVLQQICVATKYYILLEPQPSKCYNKAAFRLRRLGLQQQQPQIDVSNTRLTLRANIEEAIDTILNEFQFERVVDMNNEKMASCISNNDNTNKKNLDVRTQWNRTLRLYQRKR